MPASQTYAYYRYLLSGIVGVGVILLNLVQADFELRPASNPSIYFQPWELVTSLAWSPTGEILAIGAGNQIYLVRTATLQIIHRFEIGALTTALAFNLEGNRLASTGRDGILRLWRVELDSQQSNRGSLYPIWQVDAHRKGANTLAFSSNGRVIATGGNDAMVRIWDVKSGEKVKEIIGGAYSVPGVKFSPDGKTLAVVNGNFIRLRDPETGRIMGSFKTQESLYCLDYDPEGNFLAVGSSENQVYLWKADEAFRTGSQDYPVPSILSTHQGRSGSASALVWMVLYSPDGKLLVTAGGDGKIKVIDVEAHSQVMEIEAHPPGVTSLAFSPDGRYLASGGLDGSLRIWSLGQPR